VLLERLHQLIRLRTIDKVQYEFVVFVKWCWQGKTGELGRKRP